ncbi:MAG: LLM class F420-dependent oxidoreductase [Thermomicrobiales bacterium]
MKLGFQINDFKWQGGAEHMAPALVEMGQAAEAAGFDSIAVMDHVWQSSYMGGIEGPVLECYATLAYLAATTQRVKLMALATPPSYRYPGMLAKTVTTLDVLSGGRAWLGIGAGDYEEEARGLGIPYPSTSERFEMMEETVQICLRMWEGKQGDERPFAGSHAHLERPLNLPQSLARPHPPILIAGNGEQKTLRLVARYADACNLRPGPEVPHKLDVLRRHCDAEGTDYNAIEKTAVFRFDVGDDGPKTGELIGQLRLLAGMGVDTVFGGVINADHITPIEIMGRDVIPAIADL